MMSGRWNGEGRGVEGEKLQSNGSEETPQHECKNTNKKNLHYLPEMRSIQSGTGAIG